MGEVWRNKIVPKFAVVFKDLIWKFCAKCCLGVAEFMPSFDRTKFRPCTVCPLRCAVVFRACRRVRGGGGSTALCSKGVARGFGYCCGLPLVEMSSWVVHHRRGPDLGCRVERLDPFASTSAAPHLLVLLEARGGTGRVAFSQEPPGNSIQRSAQNSKAPEASRN